MAPLASLQYVLERVRLVTSATSADVTQSSKDNSRPATCSGPAFGTHPASSLLSAAGFPVSAAPRNSRAQALVRASEENRWRHQCRRLILRVFRRGGQSD